MRLVFNSRAIVSFSDLSAYGSNNRVDLLAALQPGDGQIRASLTLVYEGAPRVNLLKTLGCEFSRRAKNWDREALEVAHALLAVLPRNRLAAAQARLTVMSATNIVRYPWFGEPLRVDEDVAVNARHSIDAEPD